MKEKAYPEIGDRFGRWTVVDPDDRNDHGKRRVRCLCDCGNERLVAPRALAIGTSTSCGCGRGARSVFLQVGDRFGRWTVINPDAGKSRHGARLIGCRCDCGREKVVYLLALRNGKSSSCGCDRIRPVMRGADNPMTTHGMSHTREWFSWMQAIQRTTNPNHPQYPNYGGRGIKMCDRWLNSFENFFADTGRCPPGKTLDRWPDNDGDYEPGNWRWATPKQQANNKRNNRLLTFDGDTLTVAEWADRIGVTAATICQRLDHGWSVERTLTTPASLSHVVSLICFPQTDWWWWWAPNVANGPGVAVCEGA